MRPWQFQTSSNSTSKANGQFHTERLEQADDLLAPEAPAAGHQAANPGSEAPAQTCTFQATSLSVRRESQPSFVPRVGWESLGLSAGEGGWSSRVHGELDGAGWTRDPRPAGIAAELRRQTQTTGWKQQRNLWLFFLQCFTVVLGNGQKCCQRMCFQIRPPIIPDTFSSHSSFSLFSLSLFTSSPSFSMRFTHLASFPSLLSTLT